MSRSDEELDSEVLEALARALPRPRLSGDARSKLIAALEGPYRYAPFLDRLSGLFDLPEGEMRGHLAKLETVDTWESLLPGIRYIDFDAGPSHPDAHGGFVVVRAGTVFPRHTHLGPERVLVLGGWARDERDRIYRPGDFIESEVGSSHELRAEGPGDLLFAARVVAIQFDPDDDDDDDDDDD